MNLTKLNTLYAAYRKRADNEIFREIYEELSTVRAQNESSVVRSGYGDKDDALTIFHDVVLRLTMRDDIQDFGRAFMRALKNARTDFFRKAGRYVSKLDWLDATHARDNDEAATSTLLDSMESADYVEKTVVEKENEADKIALVDFILESSQIQFGPEMTAIIKGLQSDYDNVNEAATSNGLHRNQIVRPLNRLSRLFDRTKHGDIRDYFPKDVRVKREFISA